MKYLFTLLFTSFCLLINFHVNAQERLDDLCGKLCVLGFENVKALSSENQVLVCLENNVYRWDVDAIKIALDNISAYVSADKEVTLYVLNHAIVQVQLKITAANWIAYQEGDLPNSKMEDLLLIDSKIDSNYQLLEEQLFWNPNTNKVDLVIYPQMYLQNTGFNQIYEMQINLNPAVEVDLWKGMQFTGQVIVPLVNDYGREGDAVRPGFITLNQNLRFGESYFAKLSMGNFSTNRYGAHASVFRPVWKNRIEVEANLGLTGASHFYQGRWMNEDINEFNWFVKSRYFHHKYGLELALSYGKYIYGDKGIRADVIRHFGPVSISFFAMYTGGTSNGGFNFTIPLPTKKRKRKRNFRVMPSNYFDWEYNGGTEFVKGQLYETKPNANRTENIFNPIYLKSQLLTL